MNRTGPVARPPSVRSADDGGGMSGITGSVSAPSRRPRRRACACLGAGSL